jgi:hypothetical protein
MKKIILLGLVLLLATACAKKVAPNVEEQQSIGTVEKNIVVGDDRDAHGCIGSAGYTWSKLKQECVQIFDAGIRLNHIVEDSNNYSTSAFVILDEASNKAELFLDTQQGSFILERKGKGQPWINGKWKLIEDKGYFLFKGNDKLYKSE